MDPKKLNSYVGVVNQPPPKWSMETALLLISENEGIVTLPLNEVGGAVCSLVAYIIVSLATQKDNLSTEAA